MIANADYEANQTYRFTFAPNSDNPSPLNIVIPILEDGLVEPEERIRLEINIESPPPPNNIFLRITGIDLRITDRDG